MMNLFQRLKAYPEQDAFEAAFARELAVTEHLRLRLMILLFVGVPVVFVTFRYIMPETYFRLFKTAEVWQGY